MDESFETEAQERLFRRESEIVDAFEAIYSRVWNDLEIKDVQRIAREEVAHECLEDALAVVDMAYPARQNAPFTPISMMNGSWLPEREPEPPALERWVGGYLSRRV
jgi:hypothetical protein